MHMFLPFELDVWIASSRSYRYIYIEHVELVQRFVVHHSVVLLRRVSELAYDRD